MSRLQQASLQVPGFDKQKIWVNPDDSYVSAGLLANGVWEAYETELFLGLLHDDSVVLDIGANLGYYSLLAAQRCARGSVYAFEPDPLNFSLLEKNLADFNNATLFQLALGDKVESNVSSDNDSRRETLLYTSPENPGDHQIYNRGDSRDAFSVKLASGDELLSGLPRVDVIKIDVQGAEYAVFSGLDTLIRRSLPDLAIITEFYPKGLAFAGFSAAGFYDLLLSYDLDVFVIDHIKHRLFTTEELDIPAWFHDVDANPENEGFINLLLLPRKS